MRFLALLILGLAVATTASADPASTNPASAGFRTLAVPGLQAVAWYPTEQSAPVTTVAGNEVFVGVPVVSDAAISGTAHPVALLSHGYSGLWRNQAWLAERLVRAGFIAVALNQPGTTFGDMKPAWATDLAERPHQVSRVLDAVLADPQLGPRIDRERISVIGHSLGGSTALFLAGGTFDPPLLVEACGSNTVKLLCNLYRKGGLTATMAPVSARDPRISAAVLLDMEGIRGFTPDSLSRLPVPVLALVSGVEDPALPLGWEGRTQAALLPAATSRYAEIVGATHFSFMSICRPGAAEMLQQDAFVCEGETVPRPELHAEIARMVVNFLRTDKRLAFALQSP
ncbi:MAG: alpha/beta hydrolase family protein [Pseudodonghicola sp.]